MRVGVELRDPKANDRGLWTNRKKGPIAQEVTIWIEERFGIVSGDKDYLAAVTHATPERPLDIEAVFPDLREFRMQTTRLHPRRGMAHTQVSSIGGPFLWPLDEPWPTCPILHRRGRAVRISEIRERRRLLDEAWSRVPRPGQRSGPDEAERELLKSLGNRSVVAEETPHYDSLLPVAQIFAHDVPDVRWPDGADLLQVLWCPYDAHGGSGFEPLVWLVWRSADDGEEVLAVPPLPLVVGFDGYLPEQCILDPERVIEHQDIELLPDGLRDRIEAWEEADREDSVYYTADLSIAPGWKVGGFAAWPVTGPTTLTCECGGPMSLLLRIASLEWDGGSRSWMPLEDRDVANEPDSANPTHIVIGRGGSMNVFVCSVDARHPHKISIQ